MGEAVRPLFLCPSDPRTTVETDWGPTSYVVDVGSGGTTTDGLFYIDARVRMTDITDGTSNTGICPKAPSARGPGRPSPARSTCGR